MERQKQLIELMDYCMGVITIDVTVKDPFVQKKDRTDTMEAIQDILRLRNVPERQIRPLARKLYDCLFGQMLLTKLLSDPLVSNIKILAHDQNPGQYLHFVEYLLIRNDMRPEGPYAYLSFCDADSSPEDLLCFHVSSRRINSVNTPYLHIHRIPKQKKYLRDLIASGMLESQTASYLSAQARYGGCILFTGSGKQEQSTLLNALIDLIPHNRSALAIQEREELFSLSHPEIMFQHTTPTSRVLSSYDTRELMENGLLLDSDYFILAGKCSPFLEGCLTGLPLLGYYPGAGCQAGSGASDRFPVPGILLPPGNDSSLPLPDLQHRLPGKRKSFRAGRNPGVGPRFRKLAA